MFNGKIIALSITFIIILISLSACTTSEENSSSNVLNFTQQSPPHVASHLNMDNYQQEEDRTVRNTNILNKNEVATQSNYSFGNIKIYKSKALPEGVSKENFIYFSEGNIIDEHGTLISPTSYLFITIDVTNNSLNDGTFSWNSCTLNIIDENNQIDSIYYDLSSWEARYRSGKDSISSKDYFHQTIKSGETITSTIGYIIEDKWIDSKQLYFSFTPPGIPSNDLNNVKFFKIND